jgi:hypothetical protein
MYKKFITALTWNSSATFFYKIVLLLHQILLYSVISKTLYGLQSTLFAIIYTIITVTNFGFSETLLPFFSTLSKTKQQFVQNWHHFIWHAITSIFISFLFYTITLNAPGEFLHNIRIYCNKNVILIISMIILIESIKKSLIAMMQLAFLNKQIAYAEIIMLTIYIATVWSFFNIYGTLSIEIIFIPMLATLILEFFYLLCCFLNFYYQLPQANTRMPKIPFKVIFYQRICNYINQIIKTIYSPNFMTISIAYILGFKESATIKFFINIITLCYTCISKTIGVTTGAALSAMNQMPLQEIRSFFKQITMQYFKILSILNIIISILIGYALYNNTITYMMALQIILFFIINLLEHLSITYEQLFISQGSVSTITSINIVGLILLIISAYLSLCNRIYQTTFVAISIIVKIFSIYTMFLFSKKYWNIS